jgi:hypothetical protein
MLRNYKLQEAPQNIHHDGMLSACNERSGTPCIGRLSLQMSWLHNEQLTISNEQLYSAIIYSSLLIAN